MSKRTYEEIIDYVEWQSQYKCKVISAKPECTFNDLGIEVNVWNVKTDKDGAWWVVEGDAVPMNLYPQDAYYFSADEVYSFHIGLMERMNSSQEYRPEDFIRAVTLGSDIAPQIFRKLKGVADLLDKAVEIEDFQSIGVQCREILIELGNSIYKDYMAGDMEQPQASNFKRKAELFIQYFLVGKDNSDYRNIIKKITDSIWDYAAKITHSTNTTFYEASTCVTLCIALVSVFENIRQKMLDPTYQLECKNCKSKKLKIVGEQLNDEGIVSILHLECEQCGETLEIIFNEQQEKEGKINTHIK